MRRGREECTPIVSYIRRSRFAVVNELDNRKGVRLFTFSIHRFCEYVVIKHTALLRTAVLAIRGRQYVGRVPHDMSTGRAGRSGVVGASVDGRYTRRRKNENDEP